MTSILGPYCSFWHWRGEDEAYMRRLDSAWANIHQPTAKGIHVVQTNAPNANIMLRSWDIDDSNGERKREMYGDPKGAARKHLEMWKAKWQELLQELHRNNWQADESRWFLGLVNEPDPAYVRQVVEYSLEAMRLVQGTAIRLGVVASSVGTFSKPSENDQGWALCKPLEKPINDGGHILMAHEYWQPEGPNFGEDGGNLAWRHHIIPLDVPILIREAGANGYIYQRHSKEDDAGWRKFMNAEQYAAQVREYIAGCDQRVKGVCLYMLDYHSKQWETFDTQPAMEQLLAIKDTRPGVASPFATTSTPAPTPAPQPTPTGPSVPAPTGADSIVIPSTPNGAAIRSGPAKTYPKLGAIARGVPIQATGRNADGSWYRVMTPMPFGEGWVSATVVDASQVGDVPVVEVEVEQPQPTQPTPTGDKWQRSLAFTLKWEGGWADNPNDKGGATMKGITIGTYTRWRAAHGQPAPSKNDLRAIGDTELETIYREWYWKKSGADALPWPQCLAVFDLAVNGGTDRAEQFVNEVGADFVKLMARRLLWYTNLDDWGYWGNAWARRCADLMREASK